MSERDAAKPIRVLLIDDHALVRSAVRQAISVPDVDVVGEASSAEEALEVAPALQPDLILMDLDMPGMSGVQAVRELAPRLPAAKIVMLTVSTSSRDLVDAMRNGAAGYLTKDVSPDALLRAVRGIRTGELPMSRRSAAHVVQQFGDAARRVPSGGQVGPASGLTAREGEVLRLLSEGATDRHIAGALSLSPRTIETHVSNILHKLGVRNRAEAARRYREGLR
jgi:DNA-binding NarL/FixJ family response regulator